MSLATPHQVICGTCSELITKQKTNRKRGEGWVYEDHTGRIWNGGDCPDCATKKARIKRQANAKPKPEKRCLGVIRKPSKSRRKCRMCNERAVKYSYYYCAKHYADKESQFDYWDMKEDYHLTTPESRWGYGS